MVTLPFPSPESLERELAPRDVVQLLEAMQALAGATEVAAVQAVVRATARRLVGADGVTFVLRDGDLVFYAEEDAIAPLWKGQRFPATACISGWAMIHRQRVVIPDIYADPRIPVDAYRPTFVKSLAMVPVREDDPVAAIGAYWARHHTATARELTLLQSLANATAVALANAELVRDLTREKERFSGLVQAIPQLVWTAARDGALLWCNERWCEQTGRAPLELLGAGWAQAFHPDDAAALRGRWDGAAPWEAEVRVWNAAARHHRCMLLRAVPAADHWVGTCTDIQAQIDAVTMRDEFIGVASHELRTPLTALQLQMQHIERSGATDLGRRLERATRHVERLGDLVEQLLDVSRLAAGRVHLTRERVELLELVRDVAERFGEAAVRAGSALRLPTGAAAIHGRWDRVRVEQIVANLLGNAIKYGAGQPIEVAARTEGEQAVLEVRDHGIGIDAGDRERIFGRFERAAPLANYGGLGLGLYIARHIVVAHGGAIRVDSAPGAGATFTVELPLDAAEAS